MVVADLLPKIEGSGADHGKSHSLVEPHRPGRLFPDLEPDHVRAPIPCIFEAPLHERGSDASPLGGAEFTVHLGFGP